MSVCPVSTHSVTVGILYPDHAAEDDYPSFEATLRRGGRKPAVHLPVTHTTIGVDEHTTAALLETGSPARLAAGVARMRSEQSLESPPVDSLMWACTSGSFVYGWEGAHHQAAQLAVEAELPASSTSLAFVHAVQALGLSTVAVGASYPQELAQHFRQFLADGGVDVVRFRAHGVFTAEAVSQMGRESVLQMICAADDPQAEAILVPDTAMHSLLWIPELEAAVGKPVLTANQVTIWEGMRLAGRRCPQLPRLGTLFEECTPAAPHPVE